MNTISTAHVDDWQNHKITSLTSDFKHYRVTQGPKMLLSKTLTCVL